MNDRGKNVGKSGKKSNKNKSKEENAQQKLICQQVNLEKLWSNIKKIDHKCKLKF